MTQMSPMARADGQRRDHPQISQIPQILLARTPGPLDLGTRSNEPQMSQMTQMARSGHPQITQISVECRNRRIRRFHMFRNQNPGTQEPLNSGLRT